MASKAGKLDASRIFSGPESREFWALVNDLDRPGKVRASKVWRVLFSLCVRLQELEAVVHAGEGATGASPDPDAREQCSQCGKTHDHGPAKWDKYVALCCGECEHDHLVYLVALYRQVRPENRLPTSG